MIEKNFLKRSLARAAHGLWSRVSLFAAWELVGSLAAPSCQRRGRMMRISWQKQVTLRAKLLALRALRSVGSENLYRVSMLS
jgi:hypothetical protein